MNKKIRLIIFSVCILLFLIITPYIVLYSLGYRVDFQKMNIVATGGIYVKALPQGANVIIDNKTNNITSIFSNSVFVQNLLPAQHLVQIKKDGYYDYQKNLNVKERSVTKLEHVLLFKKNITFQMLTDVTNFPFNQEVVQDVYVVKNNNLYYNEIKNNDLTPLQINTPIIKNVITYKVSGNNIIWLALDGFLYNSNTSGLLTQSGENIEKLSQISLKINPKNSYKLLVFNKNIYLKVTAVGGIPSEGGKSNNLLLFDTTTKSFNNFYNPVSDIKMSPDGQKILFFNDHEILLSSLNSNNPDKTFLNRFAEKISDVIWLNDDYVIINLENKIIISEIDIRGTINIVELPQPLALTDGKKIAVSNPKISFNQQDKKLYILQDATVLVSERLIP